MVLFEVTKKTPGFKVGDKKPLTLENAKHLEKLKVGKIIGSASTNQVDLIDLQNTVKNQGIEIEKLKKEIESLKK